MRNRAVYGSAGRSSFYSPDGILTDGGWNQVGFSYDFDSGTAKIWVDGEMVVEKDIGVEQQRTSGPLEFGRIDGLDNL